MPTSNPTDVLQKLGLTGLEADIYVQLLKESPLTGYSIAKKLGKPTANVYKALDTLAHKGAIDIEDGKTRLVKPVPYQELLANFEANFQRLRNRAAASLAHLPGPESDHRIYKLQTLDQVLGKCRTMLEEAKAIMLADVFPESAELLRADFEKLVERGVRLVIRSYAPFELKGATVQQASRGSIIQERWPAQWLNLVADGEQSIVGVFHSGSDEVLQSYWTESPSLAYLHHNGLISEIAFSTLQSDVENDRSLAEMKNTVQQMHTLMGDSVPGLGRLVRNLGLNPMPENK